MNSKIVFSLLVVVTLLTQSCKREDYPEPVTVAPEFGITGTKDGEAFSIQAGVNGYHLSNNIGQNAFGVYEYTSQFDLGDVHVLSIQVNDNDVQEPDSPPNAAVFTPGEFHFAMSDDQSDFLTIHFDAQNIPDGQYHWDFGDGDESFQHNPNHTYDSPGTYTVVADVGIPGQPDRDVTFSQTVVVGTNLLLSAPFLFFNLPNHTWKVAYPGMIPPYLTILSWTIGGNDFNGNNQVFELGNGDETEVCLHFYNEISEAYGDYCMTFEGGDGPGPCVDHIHYQWEADMPNLHNVEIIYKDDNGDTYTSFTPMNNNPDHQFEITSIEDYQPDFVGGPKKKIVAHFNVWLENTDNPDDKIHFENIECELGFTID